MNSRIQAYSAQFSQHLPPEDAAKLAELASRTDHTPEEQAYVRRCWEWMAPKLQQ